MGHIYVSQSRFPELFVSSYWVHTQLANDLHLVTLTGVVLLKDINADNAADTEFNEKTAGYYKGVTSDAWRQDQLHLVINLPPALGGKWLQLENWAPFVTINAVFNQDQAINAGWAVDRFGLETTPDKKISGGVQVWADIAVRDSDGILYRVGYNVTFTGKISTPPPGPK